jgi:hypothetical protein
MSNIDIVTRIPSVNSQQPRKMKIRNAIHVTPKQHVDTPPQDVIER